MSLIIPLALKSISTIVPPILVEGTIFGLFVLEQDTYIYGNFNSITSIQRKDFASFDNITKTLTNFYQNGPDFSFHYSAAVMKTPDNNNSILVCGIDSLVQLDTTTGDILSSGPSYAGANLINYVYTDPNINNSEIFVAGSFAKISTFTKNGFAKFNNNLSFNSSWTCSPNPAYTVYAICSSHLSTHVYAGGQFTSIRGISRKSIARVRKTDGVVDTSFTYTPIPDSSGRPNSIRSMDLAQNGTLWIAGDINFSKPILRGLNENGTFYLELTSSLPSTPLPLNYASQIKINSLENKIYTSLISFQNSSGKYMGILARFDSFGNLDTTFNSPSGYIILINNSLNPSINFDFDQTNDLIAVGGRFNWIGDWDMINGNSVTNFAYLSSDGSYIPLNS